MKEIKHFKEIRMLKKIASNELKFQYDIGMNIRIRNLMYEIFINCSDDKKITIEIAE